MALKTLFCAKCGSESFDQINNLCAECYFNLHEVSVPKSKVLKVCSKCNAVLMNNFWVAGSEPKRALAKQIKHAIQTSNSIKVVKVDLIKIMANGLIEVTYMLGRNILSKKYTCNLKIQKQLCPACKQNLNTSYKAKLQLRAKSNLHQFVLEALGFMQKYKKLIIKIKELRTGVDIHLRSRSDALNIAHNFKQRFGCQMKETHEQYGWDRKKNKPKYKTTILLVKK